MGLGKYEVIFIGASTGGPRAIEKVLRELPSDIGVPILVVQHMPKGFTKSFADRLNKECQLKVVEGEEGMKIDKNIVYIAQGGKHMLVDRNYKLRLSEDPPLWGVRPAVDKMVETGLGLYKERSITVILTGMGRDGAKSVIGTKEYGGTTIAQDEATSTIYGMPKAAYETEKVDYVLALDKVANKLVSLVKGRED